MWCRLFAVLLLIAQLAAPRWCHADQELTDLLVVYRLQVYESFRRDRSEYERRCQAADQLVERYRERRTPAAKDAVRAWFQQALAASRPGSNTPLPSLPETLRAQPAADAVAVAKAHTASETVAKAMPTETNAKTQTMSTWRPFEGAITLPSAAQPTEHPAARRGSGWEWLDQLDDHDLPAWQSALDAAVAELAAVASAAPGPPSPGPSRADALPAASFALDDPAPPPAESVLAELDAESAETVLAEVSSPPAGQASGPDETPQLPVDILELNARIAGHNLALEGLEERFAASRQSAATAADLLPALVGRLESLARAQQRIRGLMERLSPTERNQLVGLLELHDLAQNLRQELAAKLESAGASPGREVWQTRLHKLDMATSLD